MNLEDLGYTAELEAQRIACRLADAPIGRVVAEHKERYIVRTEVAELEAEITGIMRFSARSREDFPAVGDWVGVTLCDGGFAIIHTILPRFSMISRQAVGQFGQIQIIATNIDFAFLIQALDRDFNFNRLERYLTICHASRVSPIVVLTKLDLLEEQEAAGMLREIPSRLGGIPVIAISNKTLTGYDALRDVIRKGKTYCLLGSSGVGKSTLLNNLSGRDIMRTDAISLSTNKGRHVTSHRELIVLEHGGILIDNPGMREVGIVDAGQGLATTFDALFALARDCKFKDCTHNGEAGCAVREAVERGDLERGAYESYLKMEKEKAYFESSVAERRKRDKGFGKMVKNYKKEKSRNRG